MPDVYAPGSFDLAGTIVGVVERSAMLPRTDIIAGDAIVALPSTGLHTNGYSLARRLVKHHFATEGYAARPAMLGGQTIGDALLAVHRCYLSEVIALRAVVPVKALCHITGGGIYDNLPRVLPAGLGAEIVRGSWSIPPICQLLVELGRLDEQEAFHTLNMGLGMLVIVPAEMVNQALATIPEARLVGRVTAGPTVRLVDA
jgi:phosphoribosylformylglycinamidine cyclo-ligase